MRPTCYVLTVLSALACAVALRAQPALVIVTEQPKLYHLPSCPVLRERSRSQMIAMTRAQAEARKYKPHDACDAANPASLPTQLSPENDRQPPVYVYTASGDTRYHRETCAKLPKEHDRVLLEEAGKKRWPCSVCRPPIRKRAPAIPKE